MILIKLWIWILEFGIVNRNRVLRFGDLNLESSLYNQDWDWTLLVTGIWIEFRIQNENYICAYFWFVLLVVWLLD